MTEETVPKKSTSVKLKSKPKPKLVAPTQALTREYALNIARSQNRTLIIDGKMVYQGKGVPIHLKNLE